MPLTETIQAVANYESAITDSPIETTPVLADPETLLVGDSRLRLGSEGLRRLCKRFSAPASYLQDLDADVRRLVLQRHLERGNLLEGDETVISQDGEFVGFGRADLHRIRGAEVLEAVEDESKQRFSPHSLQFSAGAVQADLLLVDMAEEAGPGDILRAGLRVTHSLIGEHATWIETFVLRLICKNGLTHRECGSKRAARTRRLPAHHNDARQMQIDQIRRLTNESIATLQPKLAAIAGLRRKTVEVEPLLNRWLERARLSSRLWLPILRDAWEVEGGEATAYGVMNALTRVASHSQELSSRQRRVLGGLAGLLAFECLHICPRCFSHLGGPAGETAGDLAG